LVGTIPTRILLNMGAGPACNSGLTPL
jgi:hypothetical protein